MPPSVANSGSKGLHWKTLQNTSFGLWASNRPMSSAHAAASGMGFGPKPVAAIHGLRLTLRMRNFKNPGIGRGGVMYTRVVRETQNGNPGQ